MRSESDSVGCCLVKTKDVGQDCVEEKAVDDVVEEDEKCGWGELKRMRKMRKIWKSVQLRLVLLVLCAAAASKIRSRSRSHSLKLGKAALRCAVQIVSKLARLGTCRN